MTVPTEEESRSLLTDISRRHKKYRLLRQLGFPSGEDGENALVALHAGAAYHAVAVIEDVVCAYRQSNTPYVIEIAYETMISDPKEGEDICDIVEMYYRSALSLSPDLAEAHFNLARLCWSRGRLAEAESAYRQVLALSPHPWALAHASLIANAYWNLGEILELTNRDPEALEAYGNAVKLLSSFGAHHVKYAVLLRKRGHIGKALEEFEKTMSYSHRYFPEFCLPPLIEPGSVGSSPEHLESLMRLASGEHIVFFAGRYFAIPAESYPITAHALTSCDVQEVPFAAYSEDQSDSVLGGLSRRLFKFMPKKKAAAPISSIRVSDAMANLEG